MTYIRLALDETKHSARCLHPSTCSWNKQKSSDYELLIAKPVRVKTYSILLILQLRSRKNFDLEVIVKIGICTI